MWVRWQEKITKAHFLHQQEKITEAHLLEPGTGEAVDQVGGELPLEECDVHEVVEESEVEAVEAVVES